MGFRFENIITAFRIIMPITPSRTLPFWSFMLALGVALVWGFNFIALKVSLQQIPPLTLCSLRFLGVSIPAIFFLPRPKAAWKYVVGYGLFTFSLSFSLLFLGMAFGVTPGIAALITQLQVFFAMFFAALLIRQRVTYWQLAGAVIAFSGIIVIALHREESCTWLGFLLLLGSGITWALGNVLSAKLKNDHMLSLVVWGCFIALFPTFGAALLFENPLSVIMSVNQLSILSIVSLAYTVYASTHFGYGGWAWLLSKYPMATIAPFALLCPTVALVCSSYFLGETFNFWKLLATDLVISGLTVNVFGQRCYTWLSAKASALSKIPPPV